MSKIAQEYEAKEQALKAELEAIREQNVDPDFNKVIQRSCSVNDPKNGKERTDKKDNSKCNQYVFQGLEDSKKKHADIMKENSALRSKIIDLNDQNEKLSKDKVNLTRKLDDLSSKMKKNESTGNKTGGATHTPKLTSLKDERALRKVKNLEPSMAKTESTGSSKSAVLINVSNSLAEEISEDVKEHQEIKAEQQEEVKNKSQSAIVTTTAPSTSTTIISNKLKATTAQLVMCKPTVARNNKNPLLVEEQKMHNRRSITSIGMIGSKSDSRSKSPIEIPDGDSEYSNRLAMLESISKDAKKLLTSPEKYRQLAQQISSSTGSINLSQQQPLLEPNQWKCVQSNELHSSGIFSLASFEHYLISSSKVLKVWDINAKMTTAEIPDTVSKCLCVDNAHKILLGATKQKGIVNLWDLPNLAPVKTIETGLASVKSIYIHESYLFIGGGGGSGGLQLWDLNTMTKLCDIEKNPEKEIFSVFVKNGIIYYGVRNKTVYRMGLDNLEGLAPLDPTHYGAVNVLANLNDTLISGCREYLLRSWNYETGKEKYAEVKKTGQLNAVQTDKEEQMLYAAGKDGHIKVWKIKEDRLQDVADLFSHTKSVNGLVRIPSTHAKIFASASEDKTVKIWRHFDSA